MEMLLLPLRRIFAKSDGVLDSAVDDKVPTAHKSAAVLRRARI